MVKKFWILYQTSYFYIFLFHLFMFRVYSNYSQPLQLTSRKRGIKEIERPMKHLNLILHLILKDFSSLCITCTVLGLPKSWFWDQLAFLSPNIVNALSLLWFSSWSYTRYQHAGYQQHNYHHTDVHKAVLIQDRFSKTTRCQSHAFLSRRHT